MNISRTRAAVALTSIAIVAAALTGCSAPSANPGNGGAGQEQETPADLTGNWKQNNNDNPDAYQSATITGDTIEVFWISDGGDTKALYWAGTYEAPTEPGSFTFDSQNDTSKTDSALLASGDPTKTFTYDGNTISYEVTAMGITQTVKLGRE